jgi:hypothetical protein
LFFVAEEVELVGVSLSIITSVVRLRRVAAAGFDQLSQI